MTYFIAITFIITYSYLLKNYNYKSKLEFFVVNMPSFIIIVLMLGFQFEVGTDYQSYIKIAEGTKSLTRFYRNGELLFAFIVTIVKMLGKPQLIFLFIGIIQTIFLFLTAYEINKMGYKLYLFFFLYFTLALMFFNQFNAIRQYAAIYIVVYALIKLKDNRILLFFGLMIIAGLFHSSAFYFTVIILIKKYLYKKTNLKTYLLFIFSLILLYFFALLDLVNITAIISKLISLTTYSQYSEREYVEMLRIRSVVTKLPKLLIVFITAIVLRRDQNISLEKNEMYLMNLSCIACALLVMSFFSGAIWRVYQYLDLFIIFPVLILYNRKNNTTLKFITALSLIVMLGIKILILPEGEYLYKCIFLN